MALELQFSDPECLAWSLETLSASISFSWQETYKIAASSQKVQNGGMKPSPICFLLLPQLIELTLRGNGRSQCCSADNTRGHPV